jgi:hypothetical protein
VLGYNDAASTFYQTLEEEKEADTLLTQIAENNVNYKQAQSHWKLNYLLVKLKRGCYYSLLFYT